MYEFTESEAARKLRLSKECGRYDFTVTYFTTNSTTREVRAVTKLDTWQMFRYKHPLIAHSMQYEAMKTSAGELLVTDGVSIWRDAADTISNVLATCYAARHNLTQAERYAMRIDDYQANNVDMIDLACFEIWIMQFSDKSGYYLEADSGMRSDYDNWTSSTVWTTQPTRAQAIRALLSEGGTDVEF